MKRIIRVEQKHIDRGAVAECDSCPVALAIGEQIPGIHAQIGDGFAHFYDGEPKIIAECRLPSAVVRFVRDFDNEEKVAPFSFELNFMSDFNFCRRCETVTGITKELCCETCGELVCLVCGCTESRACVDEKTKSPCGWARPGICTSCIGSVDSQGNPNGMQVAEMVAQNQADMRTNH